MPMLSELTKWKRKIANILLNDAEFVELVSLKNDLTLPAASLIGDNVYLYDYIDETVKDEKVLICIEIDEGDYVNPQSRMFNLHIYVAVHRNLMNFIDDNGHGAIRRDSICERIDHLLNGRTDLGFKKIKAGYGGRILFSNDFRTKDMHYTLQGWNLRGEALDRPEDLTSD